MLESMGETDQDIVLLLEGIDSIEASMAKNLLEEEGIPSLTKGPDFDVAELGAAHDMVRGTDLYVPRKALERARAILKGALKKTWGSQDESAGE